MFYFTDMVTTAAVCVCVFFFFTCVYEYGRNVPAFSGCATFSPWPASTTYLTFVVLQTVSWGLNDMVLLDPGEYRALYV